MQKVNSQPNRITQRKLVLLTTLLVIALDQSSKLWVNYTLPAGQSFPEKGILRLTHTTNTGAIFGLFASQIFSLIFATLALVAILFLGYCYLSSFNSPWGKIALGLMLGGGLGNLLDRIRLGYVTDFIDVHIYGDFHWPVFNLADSALLLGMIILVYLLLTRRGENAIQDI